MSKRDDALAPPPGYKRLSNVAPEDIAHVMSVLPDELTPMGAAEMIINMVKLRGLEPHMMDIMTTVMVAISDSEAIISQEVDVADLYMGKVAN